MQPSGEKEDGRGDRPIDRGRGSGDLAVSQQHDDRGRRADAGRRAEPTRGAEQEQGQDRDVSARDRDDVIRPGRLQPFLVVLRQPRAIADRDGGGDAGRSRAPRPTVAARTDRTHALNDDAHSSRCDPATTTSTNAALLTEPTSAMPRRARARCSSGTPGFRYVVGSRSDAATRTRGPPATPPSRSEPTCQLPTAWRRLASRTVPSARES